MPSGFNKKTMTIALMMALPAIAIAADEEKKTADATQTMTEVKVKTQRIQDAPNKGYQATKTRVGKTYQDPQDVPQAVTTLTRELLHDQQVGSLREALRNVVGLSVNAAEGGRSGDNFNLRGFYTFGDIYLDNMRDTAQYNRETFNLEQVDVLRGSAAMLFGRGQAGGVINQVTKMAELNDKNVVTGSLGNYDYHQATGDFNKKLTDTAAIRVNVMDRHEETYRKNPANGDHPEFDRQGLAVSFGAGIGTENEVFLNHVYLRTRDVPDYGVLFLNKRPIDTTVSGVKIDDKTFYGNSKNFDNSDTNITTGIFTHKFDDDTQLRTQLRHAEYERAYWAKTPQTGTIILPPTAAAGNGGNQVRTQDYETYNLQSDFSTKLTLAGMTHSVLTGVEYLHEKSYRNSLRNLGTTADPYYTEDAETAITPANAQYAKFSANNYAVYAQDSVEFMPHWTALVGIRRDEMKADYTTSAAPHLDYGQNSYRSGLSWQPTTDQHYYITYSNSFSPTADLYQLTTAKQPPERSRTLEVGSKWLFMDGDLALRTALFTTTKDWERNTDLATFGNTPILTKRRRTNGLEVELAGKVTEHWDVFAGLALLDAYIINVAENINATTGAVTFADSRLAGVRARNTPRTTFNLWTTYDWSNGWKVGGGVEAKADRYGYSPVASGTNANALFVNGSFKPNTAPGYARVDAMVAYEQPKWAVRLNIKNLLDKTYYDAIYDNGAFLTPGNRRQAIVTTEYKF
ncbi:TonB-dependent receptor [Methylophilus sp. DW102]|uniref:TonB-dependent receptor n=1 Tax=Methylophilus sp. DW102 TaxID=3095607 RepID=UPI0030925751|nr:TonB-dependent receptor [Methylophilus sp. DW102]